MQARSLHGSDWSQTHAAVQSDLSTGPCSSCQAYSTDLCSRIGSNTIIIAITVGQCIHAEEIPMQLSMATLATCDIAISCVDITRDSKANA